jgi:hypothetical protein
MEIEILPELKKLLRPLSPEERALLEAQLVEKGIREPLAVWVRGGCAVLLDGNNRHEVACSRGLTFETRPVKGIETLDDARRWIIRHQLGKRNLTPAEASYYRGLDYLASKQARGGDRKSNRQNDGLIGSELGRKAEAHKVSERTILRDVKYTRAVDKIESVLGEQAKAAILARDSRINKRDVPALARVAEKKPEEVKAVLAGEKSVSKVLERSKPYSAPAPKPIASPEALITQAQAQSQIFELGKRLIVSIDGGSYSHASRIVGRMIQDAGPHKRVLAQAIAVAAFEWPQNATSYIRAAFNRLREGEPARTGNGKETNYERNNRLLEEARAQGVFKDGNR